MKKAIFIFCVCILLLFESKLMAQVTVTGCVESSSQIVYANWNTNTGLYDSDPPTDLSGECYSSSDSGTSCTICMGGLNPAGHCPPSRNPTAGTVVTFTIEDCPIDDYLFPLAFSLGGLGFLSVRNRKLLVS